MVWTYERVIRMRDTDATGALFFGVAFEIAVEVFEGWLESLCVSLKETPFLLPIVHAEATYLSPLHLGDRVFIDLKVEKIGSSSFTLEYTLRRAKEVGKVRITHVTLSKETGQKLEVPRFLVKL